MNLIIIDDEPLQHFIVNKMLKLYISSDLDKIKHSDNGFIILDFLDKNKDNSHELPDIIFLDLHMPIMNGWDFLEHFKKVHKKFSKSILIYVISSSIDPNDISESKKYTFVKDYIIKPVTTMALKKIFEDYQPGSGNNNI